MLCRRRRPYIADLTDGHSYFSMDRRQLASQHRTCNGKEIGFFFFIQSSFAFVIWAELDHG